VRDGVFDADGVAGVDGGLQGFGQGLALAGGDMDGEREAPGERIEAGGIGGEARWVRLRRCPVRTEGIRSIRM
jgi:hypothetical protein